MENKITANVPEGYIMKEERLMLNRLQKKRKLKSIFSESA
jgi:hypothetical protein